MPHPRLIPHTRALVLALALLGATLGGDPSAAPAPGTPPIGLVAGGTWAAGGLSGVEGGGGVDVNYCTACAAAGSVTRQTV